MSCIFRKYEELSIALNLCHSYNINTCFFTMCASFSVGVVCNFVTLKLYSVIPLPFYFFFPSISAIIIVLCPMMIPMVVDIYENANKLHVKWARGAHHCSVGEMKYLTRKLKSMRVVGIYGGMYRYNFYLMNNSTKASFFFEMVNSTINALLSIPVQE
jgi:hypothetical protein